MLVLKRMDVVLGEELADASTPSHRALRSQLRALQQEHYEIRQRERNQRER